MSRMKTEEQQQEWKINSQKKRACEMSWAKINESEKLGTDSIVDRLEMLNFELVNMKMNGQNNGER